MAKTRGMNSYDLAYASGYEAGYILRLKEGLKGPSLVSLRRLTDALVIGKIPRKLKDGLRDEERNALVDRRAPDWIGMKWKLTEAATEDAVAKETSRVRRGPGKADTAA